MSAIRFGLIFLAAFLGSSVSIKAATYYWVGGTGNWSDVNHWDLLSGGPGGSGIPGATDVVIFDAASFSAAAEVSTIDAPFSIAALSMDGVGVLSQAAGLTVTGAISFFNGTWNTAGFAVAASSLNANPPVDNLRTLNMTGTTMTITGTSMDLRGNTGNFTLISSAASQITFTGAANITINLGTAAKTIPNLLFSGISANDVTMTSGNVNSMITFGSITRTLSGSGRIDIDQGTSNTTHKTFGNLSFPLGCRVRIGCRTGTGATFGTGVYSIYQGTVTHGGLTGGNGSIELYGRWAEFQQPVSLSTATFSLRSATRFQSTVTMNSNICNFYYDGAAAREVRFNDVVTVAGTTTMNTYGTLTFATSLDITTASNFVMTNDLGTTETVTFQTLNIAPEAMTSFGTLNAPYVYGTVNVGAESRFTMNNSGSASTITNLNVNSFSIIEFNSNPASPTTINGTITATINCRNWAWFKGSITGTQANVTLTNPHVISGLMVSDLNLTSVNLTVSGGVDNGNNTGITFGAPASSLTFYWVGSTTGNTKARAFSTGVNDNWSNPDNWALVSGDVTTVNSCIPSSLDHVVFDNNSFSGNASGSVELDLSQTYCNNMTWTAAVPATARLDQANTATLRFLYIFGNLTFASPSGRNQFEGTFLFTAHDIGVRTITSNGEAFIGPLEFDFTNGNWSVADNMDINGGLAGDIIITKGTLNGGSATISLEGDFLVGTGTAPIAFDCGTSTLTFDGGTDGNNIYARTSELYNLRVNKTSAGVDVRVRGNALTVRNNITITMGRLSDNDEGNEGPWQITGNTTGTGVLSITNNGTLNIGDNDGPTATLFPIGYTGASVSLTDGSTVNYRCRVANQTVKGNITYGNLTFSNTNSIQRIKTLDGPITVTRRMDIQTYITLEDNGFQISGDGSADSEIEMDNNDAILQLGTAASATQFPINMPVIDMDVNTTVIYNAGVAQIVRGLTGAGDASYPNVILRNPGAVNAVKTLSAAANIRSNLTIENLNTLDVSASNYAITIQGNWTCMAGGVFNDQNGSVSFNNTTTNQAVLSSGNEFYNLLLPKATGVHLVLSDPAVVANSCTFSAGNINCASPNTLTFKDNATYSGASNSAHANGTVSKIGNEAFDFPIGTGSVIRICGIATNPGNATDQYSAYYLTGDPTLAGYDRNQLHANLDHVSACEYWMISQDVGSSAVRVKLSWDQTLSCSVVDPNNLAVAHWNGTLWNDEGNSAASPLGATGTVTSSSVLASFSPFTLADLLGGAFNPLPLDLISFTAELESSFVSLVWDTRNEENVKHFVLEKSTDAVNYLSLSTIAAKGNTQSDTRYTFSDLDMKIGKSYYRLLIQDQDGSSHYSNTVVISYLSSEIKVYPNPVTDDRLFMDLGAEAEGEILVVLQDVLGRTVFQKIYLGPGDNMLEGKGKLEPGIYLVVASTNNMMVNTKILVR